MLSDGYVIVIRAILGDTVVERAFGKGGGKKKAYTFSDIPNCSLYSSRSACASVRTKWKNCTANLLHFDTFWGIGTVINSRLVDIDWKED